MDSLTLLLVLGLVVIFAAVIFISVRSARRERERRWQILQGMGFSPVEADETLTARIGTLYQRPDVRGRHELRNVSRRRIPDDTGDLYLFDLVEVSDEDSWMETQAVAVHSPNLNLPYFSLYPKVETGNRLGDFANRVVEWGLSRVGTPLPFAEFPGFHARYIVLAHEPQPVRNFLHADLARYFERTPLLTLHAGGQTFTLSELDPKLKTQDLEHMTQRVQRALDLHRLFQERR